MALSAPEFRGTTRFEILSQLGKGGMGVVYSAFDRELQTTVALKTLPLLEADATGVLRFKNEFRALRDLQHANLISLGELFEEDGQWFFTMELIEGRDLLSYVRPGFTPVHVTSGSAVFGDTLDSGAEGLVSGPAAAPQETPAWSAAAPPLRPLDEARLRDALRQIAAGLSALHQVGLVHRDIKPSNMMVTEDGRLVLLDFGLVTDHLEGADRLTGENALVGTAAYMAPEQVGPDQIGPAVDWYAVGVVLYELLTGGVPFSGPPISVILEKQKVDPPPPSQLVPGVPPDLDRLCVELLRRDPRERPSQAKILRALGVETVTPVVRSDSSDSATGPGFVGRRTEMEALERAFQEARGQGPTLAIVHGESGVGKSAMVRQVRARLSNAIPGLLTLSGRCHERESVSYKAFDGIADGLSKHLAGMDRAEVAAMLPRRAALIAQVFPIMRRVELFARMPTALSEGRDPHELRLRFFGAMRELIVNLARRRPLLLVIDDLQWADADSLALLSEVMDPEAGPHLLLIATARTATAQLGTAMDRWRGALACPVQQMALAALTSEESHDLAAQWLAGLSGRRDVDPESIVREAAGHPLFIAELVRHAVTSGQSSATAPVRLDEALWARIQLLEDAARRVLELLTVAGDPVPVRVLSLAAQAETGALSRALAALRVGNLIRSMRSRGVDTLEPYHDKIRVAVLSHLEPQPQRLCHERLAVALEAAGGADPEALAVHWRDAGVSDKAGVYFGLAADEAARAFAYDRAARLYRMSLEHLPVQGQDKRVLCAKLGEALANSGRGAEAAREFLNAAEGANAGDALEFQRRAAEQLLISGHIDEGSTCIRSVLSSVGMALAPTAQRALLSLVTRRLQLRLRGLHFREVDSSRVSESDLALIDICWSVSVGLSMVDTIRATDYQTRSMILALKAGEPRRVARALAMETGFVATAGEPARGRVNKLAQLAKAMADKLDDPHATGLVVLTRGFAHWLLGEWRQAFQLCTRAEEILRDQSGVAWELTSSQPFTLGSLMYLGELKELATRRPGMIREAQYRGNLHAQTNLHTRFADMALLPADAPEEARQEISQALGAWSQDGFHLQHYYANNALGQIALYQGLDPEGWSQIVAAVDATHRSLLSRIQVLRVESYYLRARAALALARLGEAGKRGHLGSARRDARRIAREKLSWATPLAELLRGSIWHQEGKATHAVEALLAAEQGFTAADMKLHAAAARRARGGLLGGDEGQELVASALAVFRGEEIVQPQRYAAMLAPGFD